MLNIKILYVKIIIELNTKQIRCSPIKRMLSKLLKRQETIEKYDFQYSRQYPETDQRIPASCSYQ